MFRPFAFLFGTITAIYALVVRPRLLDWGSTSAERSARLPGDDVLREAAYVTTRAVTIDAPPEAVWPWLVQMGQDRAGFYTHNWVERLLRSGIPDVHELRAEWQHLEPGDLVRTNRDLRGKAMGWPVHSVDPGRSLVLKSRSLPAGTYAFVLEPTEEGRTRLLVRDRATWRWFEWPFAAFVYEPLHAYMETGLLEGVRNGRAQASRCPGRPSAPLPCLLPEWDGGHERQVLAIAIGVLALGAIPAQVVALHLRGVLVATRRV